MKTEDFVNPAGELLKRSDENGKYWAFNPRPLPPEILLDSDLVNLLSLADRRLSRLDGLTWNVPNARLFAPFLRREALLSSRIEGTIASIPEVYAEEAGQLSLFSNDEDSKRVNDVKEVVNYVNALEYGLERLEDIPVSNRLIRELHGILMKDVRGRHKAPGEFRHQQNAIGNPGDTLQSARFVPPPPLEMDHALKDLEEYANKGNHLPPLVRLAFIHYQFETIHPFFDGNGRLGRLLIPLLLRSWGMLFHPLLYLSVYFESKRQVYYNHLYAVSANSSWQQWLSFFLEGVVQQAEHSTDHAIKIMELQLEWKQRLEDRNATANWIKFTENLFSRPVVTIPQAAEMTDMTWRAANKMVSGLIETEILTRYGKQDHPKVFHAKEIFNLFDDE